MSRVQIGWQNFWWGPVDARLPAALRIGFATVAIWVHLSWWPEVDTLLDASGQARNIVAFGSGRGFSLFCIPEVTGDVARVVHGATLLPLICMLIGVGGRMSTVLAWLVVLGWYQRVPGASSGGDRLLRFGLLYLSLGATTARWSIDAWVSRRSDTTPRAEVPALPVRLVQVQWVAMYFISGLEKVQGASWRNGNALHLALSNRTFARFGDAFHPLLELGALIPVLQAATIAVLCWELLFPVLVWMPRTRTATLAFGVLIHVGIGLTMSIGPFSMVTLVGYLAFSAPRRPSAFAHMEHS